MGFSLHLIRVEIGRLFVEDIVALSIPIVLLLCIAGVSVLRLRYRHLDRLAAQETIRGAIERGQVLTPELVAQLADLDSKHADLRRGVISIAVALAIVAFAFAVGEEDAVGPLTGIAALPFLLGLAYVGLHWFGRSRDVAAV
jgi:hypothetical protein